ncbi:hypothetical protein [Kitasatospora cineracea]|uniref:Uncharacterized protein n=1 Tax=Kitasatospora cineracea TaxID=88074 RepID=A0A3N4RV25_9ACTN|nr:hypothetical protein [Kitasatospora cineracea]RPE37188.1 hypothetical protein EDD38_5592 [Kitasatospora cineracea]
MELLWQQARRNTLISWPEDVDRRLDILVRAATAAGENTSRSQILAALVTAADPDPQHLAATLRAYRLLHTDALTGDSQRDDLPSVRNPGPSRTRR